MTWTTTPPTKPGRYGWRLNISTRPVLLHFADVPNELKHGEWWGPFDWPWESPPESVNAELLNLARRCQERFLGSRDPGEQALWQDANELVRRAEAHPVVDQERMRNVIEAAIGWMDAKGYGGDLYRQLRAALGEDTERKKT